VIGPCVPKMSSPNLAHLSPAPAPAPAPKTKGGSAMLICLRCDQLTEPTAFRAEGQVVLAVCSQCGGEVQIGELSPAPPRPRRSGPLAAVPPPPLPEVVTLSLEDLPVEPFAPPPSYCPKCIAPLGGGAMICPHCGIDARRREPGASGPPALLSEAWKGLVADWERPESHAALIKLAERHGLLGELGRLYLIYLAQRPHDRLADQGLEEVSRLAATAEAERAPDTSRPLKGALAMLCAVVGLLGYALVESYQLLSLLPR